MGTGDAPMPPLTVDPELLERYGNQLLTAAGGLPEAPSPFTVSGTDPMSQAIADRLPAMEGAIQDQLPQLKDQASKTASSIVSAAGLYRGADQQNAADIEKAQFSSATGSAGSGAGSGGGMGQLMSMPMQMAGQVMQVPMQAMGALASLPQSVMQGVQQIAQMTGGLGGSAEMPDSATGDAGSAHDQREKSEDEKNSGAAPAHARLERLPETTVAPQSGSPRHAAPDPAVDL